jgi:hypothetical protein
MEKKRAKRNNPDNVSVVRAALELGKVALGAVIRAVVSHLLDNR